MVKVSQRKINKTVRQNSNGILPRDDDDDDDIAESSIISSNNSASGAGSVSTNDKNDDQNNIQQSNVWKYATKISLEKARCNICPAEISRKGQTTSGLRRHLRYVHKMKEFEEKRINPTKIINTNENLLPDRRRKLQQLAINAIIEDGRSFSDFNKPGITKLFNSLLYGFRAPHRNTVKRNLKRLNTVHMKKIMTQLDEANFVAITTDFWCNRSSRSFLCMTGHWYNNDMVIKSKVLVFTPFFDRHTSKNIASELEQQLKKLKILDKTTTITCDGAANIKASFKSIDARIKRLQCLAHKLHLIVCNALGLWIKPQKQNSDQEPNNSNGDEEALEPDMRSLSLEELNYEDTVSDQENENDDESSKENLSESEEEADNNEYLCVDLWENDVNTDPLHANDLQEFIGNVLSKCRATIKMINKSSNLTTYMDTLKDDHGLQRSLSTDCKSRWNSTKYMIENIIKFKVLISQLHADKHELYLTNEKKQKLTSLEISSDEWLMINSIQQVLIPFDNATKMMSGQQYPTIGIALFAIRRIKTFLESYDENNSFINGMRDLLLKQIVHYIDNDTEQLDLIVFLAYFDPYGVSVLTQKERTTVERNIKQLIKDLNDDLPIIEDNVNIQVNATQTSSSSTHQAAQVNQPKNKSTFAAFLSSVSTNKTKKSSTYAATNTINHIAEEFILYKSVASKEVQKTIDNDSNPDSNGFWKTFGNQLPQLKYLAKRFLCTPATSVPSESAFSTASNLGRKQRARLNLNTLAMSVFLKDKINDVDT